MKKIVVLLTLLLLSLGVTSPTQAAEKKYYGNLGYEIFTAKNGAKEIRIVDSLYHSNVVIPNKINKIK